MSYLKVCNNCKHGYEKEECLIRDCNDNYSHFENMLLDENKQLVAKVAELEQVNNKMETHIISSGKENMKLVDEAAELMVKNKQLREALKLCEKFLFDVKFYPDGCNCYEGHECQRCRADKLWSLVDKLTKEAGE